MNDSQTVVVMTYQEKVWWDFIESNPEMVLWAFYFIGGVFTAVIIYHIIKGFFPKKFNRH